MTPNRRFAMLCAFLAVAAAVVFFAISIDHGVYAPGASRIHWAFLDDLRNNSPHRYAHELNAYFLLRKAYSIVAFSIVGFLAAPAIGERRRIPIDGTVVGAFSGCIEIAQRLVFVPESLLSSAFDVGCGALGGVIGALAWNAARAIARRVGNR